MARSQGDAGELAHEIAFLVGHRRAAVDCYSIFTVFSLNSTKRCTIVSNLIPTGTLQGTIFPSTSYQWIGQAIRMVHCLICSSTFGQSIHRSRENPRAAHTYYFSIGHLQIHTTTLHTTVTAMRWNIAIYRLVGLPTRRWFLTTVKIKRFWLVLSMTAKYPFIYTHKNLLPP